MDDHIEQRPDERYIDYMVRLAEKNLCNGIIMEPRAFFDVITLDDANRITNGSPDVFFNGEQFPIRLTHLSAAIVPDFNAGAGLDERFVQRLGLRLTFHDAYYMSREFVPIPLWLNKQVSGPPLVTDGTSSATFDRPVVLSARDTLRIEGALQETPTNGPRLVSASFTGTGMLSGRPYFFSSERSVGDTLPFVFEAARFRNDGTEPVALTDMALTCGAELNDPVGQGDIRQLAVNIRQVGNGTQADWFQGPTVPLSLTRMPSVLNGYTTGRALVHRFPGVGLLWEPGEGLTLAGLPLDASAQGLQLGISLWGYITVT